MVRDAQTGDHSEHRTTRKERLDTSNRYFYGVNGFDSVEQIRGVGAFIGAHDLDRLLQVVVGVRADQDRVDQENDRLKRLFDAAKTFSDLTPVLRYSFEGSEDPVGELKELRRIAPYVNYVQLDDVSKDHVDTYMYAARHFRADIVLDGQNTWVLQNEGFKALMRAENQVVVLDKSKGRGRKESVGSFKERINRCLRHGLNRVVVAGGFGPSSLERYHGLQSYYDVNISVDAESNLHTGGGLDMSNAKAYLNELLHRNPDCDPVSTGYDNGEGCKENSER